MMSKKAIVVGLALVAAVLVYRSIGE